ncbi:hypothetical protein NMY22_g17233 [Coprinellus aureogranulatus]|nr:hypothetical protein NMY22_g17233 [Coprinellus aureogranulatus]
MLRPASLQRRFDPAQRVTRTCPGLKKQDLQQDRPSLFKRLAKRCHRLLNIAVPVVPRLCGVRTNGPGDYQQPSEANLNKLDSHCQESTPHPSPAMAPAFEIVVVGAGGGNDERDLSALVAPPRPVVVPS